ncbi:MAG: MerR family transcriptional regulator [Blastocatellia bacterium]
MPGDEAVSRTPKYLIGTVTKLTGLSIDVVRVWERRYGAVHPARSSGGTRLYSDADVRRLRRLRQAVEQGHSISQAARLAEDELDDLIAEAVESPALGDPYAAARARFLDAVQIMDVVTADSELARAAALFQPNDFVKHIVAPILTEVGERWARREFGAAHEHLASGLLRGVLGGLIRHYPPSVNARILVLATPEGERHEFGLLLAALLAAAHGWRVVYLGADLPAAEIVHALRLTNAQVLGLSLTYESSRSSAELMSISSLVGASTRVWIGGAAAMRHRDLIDRAGWILVRDLDEFDERLTK